MGTHFVGLRVPEEEWENWVVNAGSQSLGSWIRERCNAGLTEREETSVSRAAIEPIAPDVTSRSVSPEQPRISAQQYQREFKPDFKDGRAKK